MLVYLKNIVWVMYAVSVVHGLSDVTCCSDCNEHEFRCKYVHASDYICCTKRKK